MTPTHERIERLRAFVDGETNAVDRRDVREVLRALAKAHGPVVDLLNKYGVRPAKLHASIESATEQLGRWIDGLKAQFADEEKRRVEARELLSAATRFSWPLHREGDDVNIELAVQRDGSRLWAIRKSGGGVWTRENEWEWEPLPSGRDDAFLKRARWTFEEAVAEARRLSDEARREARR